MRCPSTEKGYVGPDQRLNLGSTLFPTVSINGSPKEKNKNRLSICNTVASIYTQTSFPLASTSSHFKLTELLMGWFLPPQWLSVHFFTINFLHQFPSTTCCIGHFHNIVTSFWSASAWLLATSFHALKFLCGKAMNNPLYVLLDFTDLCHISFTYLPSWRFLVHVALPHTEDIQHL